METVELTIELPPDVARNARAEGLLNSTAVREMIEREIRRRAAQDFLRIADKMVEAGLPEISKRRCTLKSTPTALKKDAPARVVLDTNIVVSALLWHGVPYRVTQLVPFGHLELITSRELLDDLEDVISRQKFASRFQQTNQTVEYALSRYRNMSVLVESAPIPQPCLQTPMTTLCSPARNPATHVAASESGAFRVGDVLEFRVSDPSPCPGRRNERTMRRKTPADTPLSSL